MKLTPINRAGAKFDTDTQNAIHAARNSAHQAHKQMSEACGCGECQDHLDALRQIGTQRGDGRVAIAAPTSATIERSNPESVLDILNHLQAQGFLNSQQAQLAAATIAIKPMYNNKV